MSRIRNSVFGQIVLKTGLVSEEQVEEALRIQDEYREQGGRVPRLGEVMAQKGFLTVEQVKRILRKQQERRTEASSERMAEEERRERDTARSGNGSRRFGNYEIGQVLGRDPNGTTYKARHAETGKTVSLRVLSSESTADPDFVNRFTQQARKAGQMQHPHILKVISAGEVDGRLYYTSEYVPGLSLRRLLDTRSKVDLELGLEIGLCVAGALEYGHARGIFHQELSPSHIIITPEKDVKLTGFGSVPTPIRRLKQLVESAGDMPFYVAPEQATGTGVESADARTDIYSLGAVLYHAFSGQPPFRGESVEEVLISIAEEDLVPLNLLVPEVPEELSQLIEKMLKPDPDHRPQSMSRVVETLDAVQQSLHEPEERVQEEESNPARSAGAMPFAMAAAAHQRGASGSAPPKASRGRSEGSHGRRKRGRGTQVVSRARRHAAGKGKLSPAFVISILLIFLMTVGGLAYFIPKWLEDQKKIAAEKVRKAEEKRRQEELERQKQNTTMQRSKDEADGRPASGGTDRAGQSDKPASGDAEGESSPEATPDPAGEAGGEGLSGGSEAATDQSSTWEPTEWNEADGADDGDGSNEPSAEMQERLKSIDLEKDPSQEE
jgi:serine/threonine protein kinase